MFVIIHCSCLGMGKCMIEQQFLGHSLIEVVVWNAEVPLLGGTLLKRVLILANFSDFVIIATFCPRF